MDTKEKVMEIAYKLFAKKGFDGTSIRDISREAGVNLGAVTYHFGSKKELFGSIILEKTRPLSEIGREVAASNRSPREKLSTLLRESTQLILHKDPYLKAFFSEVMQGGERLPKGAVQPLIERNNLTISLIQEGIDSGSFRSCDVENMAWVFFGMMTPYVLHQPMIIPERRLGPYPAEFVDQIVDSALDLFFRGLEKGEA